MGGKMGGRELGRVWTGDGEADCDPGCRTSVEVRSGEIQVLSRAVEDGQTREGKRVAKHDLLKVVRDSKLPPLVRRPPWTAAPEAMGPSGLVIPL